MLKRLLPLVLVACALPPEPPKVRVYGGWITGCDNENICTAIHAIDAEDVTPADGGSPFLLIRHHPQRDAIPEIHITDPANPAPDAMLRPTIATIMLDHSATHKDGRRMTYYAFPDFADGTRFNVPGSYRFKHEDVRSIIYGLRKGVPVMLSIGPKRIALNPTNFSEALAHFDREQELEGTPGAMILRPDGVMYDYAHPPPPDAPTVELARFDQKAFDEWLRGYLRQHPGQRVKHDVRYERGLILAIRYKSFDFDCGVYERWGYQRGSKAFVLVERREMPVCVGIREAYWVRTHRADTISPDAS